MTDIEKYVILTRIFTKTDATKITMCHIYFMYMSYMLIVSENHLLSQIRIKCDNVF